MNFKKLVSFIKDRIESKNYKSIFAIENLKKKFKIFVRKRWKIKVISLIISIFVFFYLQLINIDKVVLTLPLSVKKKSSQIILNDLPKTITVHLAGIKRKIDSINVNQLEGKLDLIKKKNGIIKSYPTVLNLQEDIKVTKIIPEMVEVKISSTAKKWLEVIPKIEGVPNKKYNYVDYSIKPKMVLVSGPKEIINEISQIITEPISIRGISFNQKYSVDVSKAIHPKLSLSKKKSYEVVIYVAAKEKEIKMQEDQFPINLLNYPEDKSIVEDLPMIRDVILSMSDNRNLQEIKRQIYFYIELTEKQGEYIIQTRKIPNCKIVNFFPKKVTITYEEEKKVTP